MKRRILRALTRRAFNLGYDLGGIAGEQGLGARPRRPLLYAVANGLESAWTVEGWRHAHDQRAVRYHGIPMWTVFLRGMASASPNPGEWWD